MIEPYCWLFASNSGVQGCMMHVLLLLCPAAQKA
jgi:hypothetical protein